MGRTEQKYQVNMFRRKQRLAPSRQKGWGLFTSSREIPGTKFWKRK